MAEHIPSILYAPTFCINVNQAILHKDIRCQITLNDLVMNKPAFFKHNQAGTCIHHPHKSNKVWPHTRPLQGQLHWLIHSAPQKSNGVWVHTFLLHLLNSSSAFCISHVPISWQFKSPHVSRWHLVEHSPRIINVPTFCIHANQATPHKDIRLATTLNEMFMNKPAIFMCS